MGYTITSHNPAEFTDDEIAVGCAFRNAMSAEILPDEPPTPVDVAITSNRSVPPRMRRRSFRAWAADGTMVGGLAAAIDREHDDNPDVLPCDVSVLPDHRRQGVGTALLAEYIAFARSEGRTRFIGGTTGSVPAGAAFAEAMGAESKSAQHMNHLPTAEVDRPLMQRWVDEGPARAPDYELMMWDGAIPEQYLADFVDLAAVMNDAPRDAMELNDFTLTAEQLREQESQMEAVGYEHWTVVARRVSDGALAGFHDVMWSPHDPGSIYVGSTGVRREHRGHALGRWLKAAVTLRVLDERPDCTDIRTANADSNDAMLGINKQMGYRPLIASTAWEIAVEDAASWVKSKGVDIPAS